jgi:hypothetical protein
MPMTDFTTQVAKTVGQHFVTLSCEQHPVAGPPTTLVFSGFLVEVKGLWLYVTAGHILRRLRVALDAGSTFDTWRLWDYAAGDRFQGLAIPFDFRFDLWDVVFDDELGLDYAAVPVEGLYRQQLEAGGARALGRAAWSNHVASHDHWALFGVPSESVNYDGERFITGRVVMTPLEHAETPELAKDKEQHQFFAKPLPGWGDYFKDADGLSGGPVFGFRRGAERWRYGIIGVQSAWYRSSGILAICPFSSFGMALEELVDEEMRTAER